MPRTNPEWPTPDHPAQAIIGPTGYGTFGIVWRDFPAMERRGGYSGPYPTLADAVSSAHEWMRGWDLPLDAVYISQVDKLPEGNPYRE